MRPSEALSLHRTQIREVALSHRVSSIRAFGSALRGGDAAGSDVDLLVEPTAQTTLMDIGAIRFKLKQLLDIEVDSMTLRTGSMCGRASRWAGSVLPSCSCLKGPLTSGLIGPINLNLLHVGLECAVGIVRV